MSDRAADPPFYGSMILLPLAVLAAKRPPLRTTLRMATARIAIFAVGLVLVSQRDGLPSASTLLRDQRVTGGETRINQASDGHYWATAVLNGVSRRMLPDSGVTTTARFVDSARAIDLDLGKSPFPVTTVRRVTIGAITAIYLGVVALPAFGTGKMPGMNFLSRLQSWRVEGRTLTLTLKLSRNLHNVHYRTSMS